MATRKTQENDANVQAFLSSVGNETRRKDSFIVAGLMESVTGAKARMWCTSIVGFGKRRYAYANGRPAEICKIGFAPRAKSLVLYLGDFDDKLELLDNLGKHKLGRGGCLYINKLADVDLDVLKIIFDKAYSHGD